MKARKLFFILAILVIPAAAPRVYADSGCVETEMLRVQRDAYVVVNEVQQYVDGSRRLFDSPEKALQRLENAFKVADLCGADIQSLKSQRAALVKKVWYAAAQGAVADLREYAAGKSGGTAQWFIAIAFEALLDAKASKADTSRLDADFVALCRKARRTEAVRLLSHLEDPAKNPASSYHASIQDAVTEVRQAIEDARRSGAPTDDLKGRLERFERSYQASLKTAPPASQPN